MVHWQSESDLDSIRNSCDVFNPIEYINTIYSPFGWHFSRIKFADFSLRGGGRGYLQISAPPTPHPHEEESTNQRIAFFLDSKLRAGHVEKESSLQIDHHRHN